MKKNNLRNTITLSIILMGSALYAKADAEHKSGPCQAIRSACEAAGFHKGGHKDHDKGLWKDCMDPILAGKTVSGVTATADQVSACQAARAKHAGKKAGNKKTE